MNISEINHLFKSKSTKVDAEEKLRRLLREIADLELSNPNGVTKIYKSYLKVLDFNKRHPKIGTIRSLVGGMIGIAKWFWPTIGTIVFVCNFQMPALAWLLYIMLYLVVQVFCFALLGHFLLKFNTVISLHKLETEMKKNGWTDSIESIKKEFPEISF